MRKLIAILSLLVTLACNFSALPVQITPAPGKQVPLAVETKFVYPETCAVATTDVNLRSAPEPYGLVLIVIHGGEVIHVQATLAVWWQAWVGKWTGYVNSQFLHKAICP